MAEIIRLSFPEYGPLFRGIPYFEGVHDETKIRALLEKYRSFTKPLLEGEYDLTPRAWIGNKYTHQLIVMSRGKAIYRAIPRTSTSALRTEVGVGPFTISQIKTGGHVINIPEDKELIIVAGGLTSNPSYKRIFEVIACVEDPPVIYLPGRTTFNL